MRKNERRFQIRSQTSFKILQRPRKNSLTSEKHLQILRFSHDLFYKNLTDLSKPLKNT